MFKNRILLITLTSLLLNACSLSSKEISKYGWKYSGGFHVSDVLVLKNKKVGDTIFKNEKPIAVLIKAQRRISMDNQIVVQSIETGEQGFYIDKFKAD